jgi:hypothetical protein
VGGRPLQHPPRQHTCDQHLPLEQRKTSESNAPASASSLSTATPLAMHIRSTMCRIGPGCGAGGRARSRVMARLAHDRDAAGRAS